MKKQNLVLFAVVFLACVGSLISFPSESFAVRQGGILKVALAGDPDLLDPHNTTSSHSQPVMVHIFEALTPQYYDEKKEQCLIRPETLVIKWTVSKDGKVWTFLLRKGVKFHDGTRFNAEAVKFNIDRMKADKPKTMYGSRITFAIDKVEVVDELTIKMYLNQKLGPFIHIMGDFMGAMVSPESVKKYGADVGRHPVGTGPFKFVKWVTGNSVELEAFKDYWGGRPPLDGIIFRFAADSNARINMLQTGEVDMALNIPIQDHERLSKAGFDIATWPSCEIMRLWLDCAVPPTNDVRVRQAIKMAIDSEGMTRDIYQGKAKVADSDISSFSFGYYPADPHRYNLEKAKMLLTEAGWIDKGGYREKDGKKLALKIYSPPAGYHLMGGEALLAIQESLRLVGFDSTVSISDYSSFVAERYGKTLEQRVQDEKNEKRGDAHFVDWGSRTEAFFTLKTRIHSRSWYPDKTGDGLFYRNTELEELVDKSELELDSQKRFELYKKIQIILAHDTPLVSLWAPHKTIAKKKYVQGLQYRPVSAEIDHMDARKAWLDKK